MPFGWSLNPYRGCVHGCHYCYARASHAYLGMNAGDDFSNRIVVKTNMPEVLRHELGRPSWARQRVAIGTATDAYQPCEGRYRLTRRCLEAFRDFDTPVSIVTKSTLVLRDRDLLMALAAGAGATVHFTITTLDDTLWRVLEPGTPPPHQRLQVMRRLADSGIPCGVFLAPVLPGITDSEASIAAVAAAAQEHGALSFWSSVLRLAPLVKEHYFGFIGDAFPTLAPRYARAYAETNAPDAYLRAMEARIARIQTQFGFDQDPARERPSAGRPVPSSIPRSARSQQLALPI
ncbi:MAG: radical SAM protein [Thermomicrobiales bacterium]